MTEQQYKGVKDYVADSDWVLLKYGRFLSPMAMYGNPMAKYGGGIRASKPLHDLGIRLTPDGRWLTEDERWGDLQSLATITGKPVISHESYYKKTLPIFLHGTLAFPDGTSIREKLSFYARWTKSMICDTIYGIFDSIDYHSSDVHKHFSSRKK